MSQPDPPHTTYTQDFLDSLKDAIARAHAFRDHQGPLGVAELDAELKDLPQSLTEFRDKLIRYLEA